jgi:poly(3-hydroxybutyrate) depolymerase
MAWRSTERGRVARFLHGDAAAGRSLIGACAAFMLACSGEPEPGIHQPDGAGSAGTAGAASGGGGASTAGQSGGGNGAGGLAGSAGGGGDGGAAGSAGSGGASSGGSAGSGGGMHSTGCGSTTALQSGRSMIDVDGTMREYVLDVPNDYDPNRPYVLIFGWHWRGANAQAVVDNDYYGLKPLSNGNAIFVSPEGLIDDGVSGWANPGGRDIKFTMAMVERFESELCIDESRIFSTGFSYGAMMSFAVGCALGDVFRAIAPYAGSLWSGCEDGTAPVALWGTHGYSNGADGVVPIAAGREARDEFLARNGCGTDTVPVAPDECVSYQGCKAGYPVTWCEWDGGHWWPSFASPAVWDFFSQF